MVTRVTPWSWGTSNGTFVTKHVGDIEIAFVDYSESKKVRLRLMKYARMEGVSSPAFGARNVNKI